MVRCGRPWRVVTAPTRLRGRAGLLFHRLRSTKSERLATCTSARPPARALPSLHAEACPNTLPAPRKIQLDTRNSQEVI